MIVRFMFYSYYKSTNLIHKHFFKNTTYEFIRFYTFHIWPGIADISLSVYHFPLNDRKIIFTVTFGLVESLTML